MKNWISAAVAIGMLAITGCMTTEAPSKEQRRGSGSGKAESISDGESFRINDSHDPADYLPHLPDSVRAEVDSAALMKSEMASTPGKNIPALRKSGTGAGGFAVLCAGINFAEPCWQLELGLDYNDLRFKAGLGNDVISSAFIDGLILHICDANNFGGCYPATGEIRDFRFFPYNGGSFNFNDRVSSFKFQAADDGNALFIYDSPNYGGTSCVLLSPFDYNYPPCNMNDRTSSFRFYRPNVVPEKNIWVRDIAGFDPTDGFIHSSDAPNLGLFGLDNKISSFRWTAKQ